MEQKSTDRRAFCMSFFLFRFPAALRLHRNVRRNLYPDTAVIEIRIVVTPAVIFFLRCDLISNFRGLCFSGTQPLIQVGSMNSAIRNCSPQANHSAKESAPSQVLSTTVNQKNRHHGHRQRNQQAFRNLHEPDHRTRHGIKAQDGIRESEKDRAKKGRQKSHERNVCSRDRCQAG